MGFLDPKFGSDSLRVGKSDFFETVVLEITRIEATFEKKSRFYPTFFTPTFTLMFNSHHYTNVFVFWSNYRK